MSVDSAKAVTPGDTSAIPQDGSPLNGILPFSEVGKAAASAQGGQGSRGCWSPQVAARLRNTLVLFGVILLMSLSATVPYLLNRVTTKVQTTNPPQHSAPALARSRPVPLPLPEVSYPAQTVAVQTVQAIREDLPEPPEPPASAPLVNSAFPAAMPDTLTPELAALGPIMPGPGLYLQVTATTLTLAKQVKTQVSRTGLTAYVVPGPSERIFRVVIGPLASKEEILETRQLLNARGHESFLRLYSLPGTTDPVR
jgi:hypothetical protein